MEKEDQKKIVSDLCNSIRDKILEKIDIKKIPKAWDGIELRWLLADNVNEEIYYNYKDKRNKRYKEFKDITLINNL